MRTVALGGGHGLAASLSALRQVTSDLTAVVTVADDGGSSGRLRAEFGCLPPGDLRRALAALCDDDEWGRTWAEVLQHRFSSTGELAGHAVGNLLIVALWERLGTSVEGLDWVGKLLGARGRVLPMAAVPLEISAEVMLDGRLTTVRGQVNVGATTGEVRSLALIPPHPPACSEAVEAVLSAERVVFGPGSWFSSVLPHLMVPELSEALHSTPGRRILVLNLAPQAGETRGFSPERHLEVFGTHAPDLRVDVVVADDAFVADRPALESAAAKLGAELVVADVACTDGTPRHDATKLAQVYATLL